MPAPAGLASPPRSPALPTVTLNPRCASVHNVRSAFWIGFNLWLNSTAKMIVRWPRFCHSNGLFHRRRCEYKAVPLFPKRQMTVDRNRRGTADAICGKIGSRPRYPRSVNAAPMPSLRYPISAERPLTRRLIRRTFSEPFGYQYPRLNRESGLRRTHRFCATSRRHHAMVAEFDSSSASALDVSKFDPTVNERRNCSPWSFGQG